MRTPSPTRRLAPPGPAAPPTPAGVGTAEEDRVRSDVAIRRAMDLFDGTLMSVHRSGPKPSDIEAIDGGRTDDAGTTDENTGTGVD